MLRFINSSSNEKTLRKSKGSEKIQLTKNYKFKKYIGRYVPGTYPELRGRPLEIVDLTLNVNPWKSNIKLYLTNIFILFMYYYVHYFFKNSDFLKKKKKIWSSPEFFFFVTYDLVSTKKKESRNSNMFNWNIIINIILDNIFYSYERIKI